VFDPIPSSFLNYIIYLEAHFGFLLEVVFFFDPRLAEEGAQPVAFLFRTSLLVFLSSKSSSRKCLHSYSFSAAFSLF